MQWLSTLESYAPATLKLMPWLPKNGWRASLANVPELLGMTILGRELIGLTRIGADWPTLNPNDISDRKKTDTLLERVFTEGIGTIAGFGVLQAAQDVTGGLLSTLFKGLHPKQWLESIGNLPASQKQQVEQALLKTFKVDSLDKVKNPLTHLLYGTKGNLAAFQNHLDNPELFKAVEAPFKQAFKQVNRANALLLAVGMAVNVAFTGFFWQKLNDGLVREKVIPGLLNLMGYSKDEEGAEESSLGSSLKGATLAKPGGMPITLGNDSFLPADVAASFAPPGLAALSPSLLKTVDTMARPAVNRLASLNSPPLHFASFSSTQPLAVNPWLTPSSLTRPLAMGGV
jgi:hypothetical protein